LSGEPKETAIPRDQACRRQQPCPAQRTGTSARPRLEGNPQTSRQLISRRRAWQRVRIAVNFPNAATPLLRCTMFLAAPLDFQLRLDRGPQQVDERCHVGVCRVFIGIPVNELGARSRAWVTSVALAFTNTDRTRHTCPKRVQTRTSGRVRPAPAPPISGHPHGQSA
jgi:hypothetical protein